MIKPGQSVVYMCLAGICGPAWVRSVRPDNTVDIGCYVGCNDLHELTRIVCVEPSDLSPGTCSISISDDPNIVTLPCRPN